MNEAYEKTLDEDTKAIELWRTLVADGENIPFTMPVQGISMLPFLKAYRDSITIIPLRRELILGDVIVFYREDGKYIVHRVREFSDCYVETIGDNLPEPDKRFTRADICGLVTHIRRKDKVIFIDTPLWRFYGRVWMLMLPIRTSYRQWIKIPLRRLIRRLFKI